MPRKNVQKKEQKKNFNFKYIIIAVPVILILLGAYYFLNSNSNSNQGIIGNRQILAEISRLILLTSQRNLTTSDFNQLQSMVKGDPVAEDYVADAVQFAKYGINVHIGHDLGDLYTYILTGKNQVCIPHELEHLGTFIQVNDFSRSNDILTTYNTSFNTWYQYSLQEKSKFPVLYADLDTLVTVMNRAVQNYKTGNYQAVLTDMSYITSHDYIGCALSTGQ